MVRLATRNIGFLLLLITPYLGAQTSVRFPALEAEPQVYRYARLENTWQALTQISLWASGVKDAAEFEDIIAEAVDSLRLNLPADPRERGSYILSFMHRRYLNAYSYHQTRLDTIFMTGQYNCVSSAVLYMILAVSADLDVKGVITKDHAFIQLNTGLELIDVETTNPYGFDPGGRKEFHDGFGNITGFAYVPARNYRDRATVSPLELISLILSNRISELESTYRYNDSIPLAVNRTALLTGEANPVSSPLFPDPRQELIDRLLYFGANLLNTGKTEEALRWFALTEDRYPDPRWQEFTYTAVNNLMAYLLGGRRIAEAWKVLREYTAHLSSDQVKQLTAMLTDFELVQATTQIRTVGEAENALAAIAEAQGLLPARRIEEFRNFAVLKGAELVAAEKGWAGAIAFTEAAAARYGTNGALENSLKVFRSNRIAELHNAFADLYNRRDYEGARAFIRQALAEFPDNRQLIADRNLADKAR
ncbi:MAG: hypothetical protein LBG73_04475 [Spirochaetaceae bacterium]|jgi:tetratricopeptide (TPR) repeat protein|nr:hypothetical protein [Spirochaetaceae bacterium]